MDVVRGVQGALQKLAEPRDGLMHDASKRAPQSARCAASVEGLVLELQHQAFQRECVQLLEVFFGCDAASNDCFHELAHARAGQ